MLVTVIVYWLVSPSAYDCTPSSELAYQLVTAIVKAMELPTESSSDVAVTVSSPESPFSAPASAGLTDTHAGIFPPSPKSVSAAPSLQSVTVPSVVILFPSWS